MYDLVEINIYESFNKYIRQAMEKPVITMLEMIRKMLMRRLQNKRESMEGYSDLLCPKLKKKLANIDSISKYCTLDYAGANKWEVSYHESTFVVDIGKQTCGCRQWDVSGLPCMHAMSAINQNNLKKEDLVHPYLLKELQEKLCLHD